MRTSLFSTILVCMVASTAHAGDDGEARFAGRLYGEVARQPGNLFLSPTSIRFALGLAYAGARGESAEQMRRTLELPAGKAAHDQFAEQLKRWEALANPTLPGQVSSDAQMQRWQEEELERRTTVLHLVNRFWANKATRFLPDYLALLQDRYRASAVPVDFQGAPEPSRHTINQWVSDETHKKIPELIGPGRITKDTRSVLVNAIYFKASWADPFEPSRTKTGDFHVAAGKTVKVPLMNTVEHFALAHADGVDLLELPYGDGKLSMVIALPQAKDGLAAVEKKLAGGALPEWLKRLTGGHRVDVTLPRFKMGASFELADVLQKLGMPLPFKYPGADFSGIDGTKLLYLSAVIHQAVVNVDEKGTEAAAATAVMARAGGMPSQPVPFRADHPFVFVIRDRETNAILFIGRVADPSQS